MLARVLLATVALAALATFATADTQSLGTSALGTTDRVDLAPSGFVSIPIGWIWSRESKSRAGTVECFTLVPRVAKGKPQPTAYHTIDVADKDAKLSTKRWKSGSSLGYLLKSTDEPTKFLALNRYYNRAIGDYYYSVDSQDLRWLPEQLGYVNKGIVGYVAVEQESDTTQLYRTVSACPDGQVFDGPSEYKRW